MLFTSRKATVKHASPVEDIFSSPQWVKSTNMDNYHNSATCGSLKWCFQKLICSEKILSSYICVCVYTYTFCDTCVTIENMTKKCSRH